MKLLKEVLNSIYDSFKKDKSYILCLKILGIVISCILLLLIIKQIYPILLLGVVLFFVYYDDIKMYFPKPKNSVIAPDVLNNTYHCLSEPLCRIIKKNADVLNIVAPSCISEINTIHGDGVQYISNIPFFRYIVLNKPNCSIDHKDFLELLQSRLIQELSSGHIPNVQYPFYNDLPFIYVINVDDYLYASKYTTIDIILINDSKSYQYAKALERQRLLDKQEIIFDLHDKDF